MLVYSENIRVTPMSLFCYNLFGRTSNGIFHSPEALSLDPELNEATPSGLCVSRIGLDGDAGVFDVSELGICMSNKVCFSFVSALNQHEHMKYCVTVRKCVEQRTKRNWKCINVKLLECQVIHNALIRTHWSQYLSWSLSSFDVPESSISAGPQLTWHLYGLFDSSSMFFHIVLFFAFELFREYAKSHLKNTELSWFYSIGFHITIEDFSAHTHCERAWLPFGIFGLYACWINETKKFYFFFEQLMRVYRFGSHHVVTNHQWLQIIHKWVYTIEIIQQTTKLSFVCVEREKQKQK